MITQNAPKRCTSEYIIEQVREWKDTGTLIHEESAKTIAGWSIGNPVHGEVFALFALNNKPPNNELLEAITAEWLSFADSGDWDSVKDMQALEAYAKAAILSQ